MLVLGVSVACGGEPASEAPRHPVDVLLVTIDTQRAGRIGAYGDPPWTPTVAIRSCSICSAWPRSSSTSRLPPPAT